MLKNKAIILTLCSLLFTSFQIRILGVRGSYSSSFWANINMPEFSHFKFLDPPTDINHWRRCQAVAASGQQIILQEIIKKNIHPFNIVLGDITFRKYEKMVDYYIDNDRMFSSISNGVVSVETKRNNNLKAKFRKKMKNKSNINNNQSNNNNPALLQHHEYAFPQMQRHPIVQNGYMKIYAPLNFKFYNVPREQLLNEFNAVKQNITSPFILISVNNENWGFLSTHVPNRTKAFEYCCDRENMEKIINFFNDDKVLMVVINQHSNISHPKLLTMPLGLHTGQRKNTVKIIYDAQKYVLRNNLSKRPLLLSISSSWGTRPDIVNCIYEKFKYMSTHDGSDSFYWYYSDNPSKSNPDTLFENISHFQSDAVSNNNPMIYDRISYYTKLALSRFVLMLPGIGYDCYRNWEILSMGSVGVLERGVGLDRMFWKLPILLVDDFFDVTPQLLASAYIQVLYSIHEFEFERLTQDFWNSIIYDVSISGNIDALLNKFPMKAEDENFTRPYIRYNCGPDNSNCGTNTKRTPLQYCDLLPP